MTRRTYSAACGMGIYEEMVRDPRVFILGEDVRESAMGRTTGLFDQFGPDRVRNTPISEAAIMGAGIGAAIAGMRPIVDLFMSSFYFVAADQLLNNAAKLRYMTGGQIELPLTVLASTGSPGSIAAQHSDTPYAQIINSGGVKVLLPTTPQDAKGLIKAAIRDPNPVLVLLPMALGGSAGEVPDDDYITPMKAATVRNGSDVTVVALGEMLRITLLAAEQAKALGVEVEVLDPRALHPFDYDAVIASVRKTGRLIVVDEAKQSCSVASEIVARLVRATWTSLRAAPRIVANPDTHIPYAPVLEAELKPNADRVLQCIRELVQGECAVT